MAQGVLAKAGNKGLTVKINLWALDKYKADFDAEMARLWIKGEVTNADTRKSEKFQDPGELLTILGRWNRNKLAALKKGRR